MRLRSLVGSGLVLGVLAISACGDDEKASGATATGGGKGGSAGADMGEGGAQGGSAGSSAPVEVDLDGSVQKGPFVQGSSVEVSTVDALGNPTGQVFNTQTDDDLGSFSLTLTYQGGVSVEGNGYYYNEVLGELSASDLTLRGFYNVTSEPSQVAYVNILTHLIHGRVKTLLEDGSGAGGVAGVEPDPASPGIPSSVIEQAESELMAALAVGGDEFALNVRHSQINMVGADNVADAYLFAVSVIFTEIARANTDQSGGSLEAELQELLNTASSEFADTGQLPQAVTGFVPSVQQTLDIDLIMDMLRARLLAVNSGGTVPDLRRVWDSDADGLVDAGDNCQRVYNPDQEPINDLCSYRRQVIGGFQGQIALFGEFTGDGNQDILVAGDAGIGVLAGDGTGALSATPVVTELGQGLHNAFPDNLLPSVRDVNGDGHLDFIVNGAEAAGRTAVYWGDGSGAFSTPTLVVSTPISHGAGSVDTLIDYAILDVNGDGLLDFVGSIGTPEQSADELYVLVNQGNDTWGGALPIVLPDAVSIAGIASADLDGDGSLDLVLTSSQLGAAPGGLYLLWGTGATSEPFFSADAAITSAGTMLGDVVIGDVVGSADLDLVVSSAGPLSVLAGDGARGFAAPGAPLLGAGPFSIGDVSGDGVNDIITGGFGGIGALLGDGSAFTEATAIAVTATANVSRLSTGDLNGDGKADAVAKFDSYASLPFDCAVFVINPE